MFKIYSNITTRNCINLWMNKNYFIRINIYKTLECNTSDCIRSIPWFVMHVTKGFYLINKNIFLLDLKFYAIYN